MRQPSCFKDCPRPNDQNSDCWVQCLFETIVGNATKSPPLPPTPKAVIVRAFEQSFESDSPAKGGCADVLPCPEPCHPPCWAVPDGDPCGKRMRRCSCVATPPSSPPQHTHTHTHHPPPPLHAIHIGTLIRKRVAHQATSAATQYYFCGVARRRKFQATSASCVQVRVTVFSRGSTRAATPCHVTSSSDFGGLHH